MSSRATRQLAQLWQLPLLLLSLILFAVSGYLFVNASPGLTVRKRMEIARTYLEHERPEAALQQLNRLLIGERLTQENEALVHLLTGEALAAAQQQRKINIPANHERIIEQTKLAVQMGVKPTSEVHRRLGDSLVALGRTSDGVSEYRMAMSMEPSRALVLRKKIVEAQAGIDDSAGAMTALDDYLASRDIADAERAWALGEKSQILADRGEFVAARSLIADSIKLDTDPLAQAQANYRMAYCAWKLNKPEEAEKLARLAREQFRGAHPLDADAAYLLARLRHEANDLAGALNYYDVVIGKYPESRWVLPARLGQATCHVNGGQELLALSELREIVTVVMGQREQRGLRDQTIKTLERASQFLSGKLNYELALSALELEKSLVEKPAAELLVRLATACQKRAEQLEATAGDAGPDERVRREQLVRELFDRAAQTQVELARAGNDVKAFWAGIDLFKRAKNPASAAGAMEMRASERADDAGTADVLFALGENYAAGGAHQKAIAAFKQLQAKFTASSAAQRSMLPLARSYMATGTVGYPSAERVLSEYLTRAAQAKDAGFQTQQASLKLALLHYRTDQFEKATRTLEELLAKSPASDVMDHATYLAADCYRKTAMLIDAKIASTSAAGGAAELGAAAARKKDLLVKARGLYDQVVDRFHKSPPAQDDQRQWERQSYFYRGDCAYEIGNYGEAISLYDAAAKRYQQEPAALAAFVQIVNSNCALNKMDDARIANDKAKALLRNLPAEAFNNGSFTMPKSYWEQWLKWNSMAGAW